MTNLPGWSNAVQLSAAQNDVWYNSLAAAGSAIHMVRGNDIVMYRRSLDEGANWGPEVPIVQGSVNLDRPLAADGQNVYLLYLKITSQVLVAGRTFPSGDIYFRASTDNGATWGHEVQLSTGGKVFRFSIGASGGKLHVVWMDQRVGDVWNVYYNRSLDNGVTWKGEVKLVGGTNGIGAGRPDVAVAGDNVHVVWMDARNNRPPCTIEGGFVLPICTDVYYKASHDGGASFGPDTMLSNGMTYGGRPTLTLSDIFPTFVALSYDNNPDGHGVQQFYRYSIDNGRSWIAPVKLSAIATATHGSLAISGMTMQLGWMQEDKNEVRLRRSTNIGYTWEPEQIIPALGVTLAKSPRFFHMLTTEMSGGLRQLFYRRTV